MVKNLREIYFKIKLIFRLICLRRNSIVLLLRWIFWMNYSKWDTNRYGLDLYDLRTFSTDSYAIRLMTVFVMVLVAYVYHKWPQDLSRYVVELLGARRKIYEFFFFIQVIFIKLIVRIQSSICLLLTMHLFKKFMGKFESLYLFPVCSPKKRRKINFFATQ